jgi:catechol 2,3-dioxygenase-like lactoylglutathione lyase family enzyme
MTAAPAKPPDRNAPPPVRADVLAGVVLEVQDLASTRAFYDQIFRASPGEWQERRGRLLYQCGLQTIEFVQRAQPRTFADGGHHQAYRVPRGHFRRLVDELPAQNVPVDWWREDHPSEREVTAYVHDPSGNRVQLIASDGDGPLLDHAAVEVFMFDYCEYLYVSALGAEVDFYYGWRTVEHEEAKQWATGDDPCAPWTRRDNPNYRDFLIEDPATGELRPARFSDQLGVDRPAAPPRVARPNGQVFLSYGDSRVVLVSATKVRQEPPEDQAKGTPRLVLQTEQSADEAAAGLAAYPFPQRREGRNLFLRDADGNFVQLICGR